MKRVDEAVRVHEEARVDGSAEWIYRKSGWAGTVVKLEKWMGSECVWVSRADGTGRVEKARTMDGPGR